MDLSPLIRRCQLGDEEALAALFHRYKNLVYRTAYLTLDDAEEAEDVLQDVFVRVYRALSTFDPAKGAFTTWLHRITVNQCLSRRRKHRLLTIPIDQISPGSAEKHQTRPAYTPEDDEAIQQALNRLGPKLRTAVILRYYLELSYKEMAQVLDIPIGTVKSRLDRALKTLRREVGPLAEEAPAPCATAQSEVAQ